MKLLLGLLTILPIIYTFAFVYFISSSYSMDPTDSMNRFTSLFPVLFTAHFLIFILEIVLLVVFILNVFRNNHIPKDQKALWAIVLFLGNIIAMPIYWYLYIWKTKK